MEQEYMMLREEIVKLEEIINHTVTFFYAFIAGFLMFVVKQEDTILVLLSYIVLLPAYIMVLSKYEGIFRIGAYLKVYHEGEIFNWETRTMKLKRINHRNNYTFLSSAHFPFLFTNFFIAGIYILKIDYKVITQPYEVMKVAALIFLFVSVLVLCKKNRNLSVEFFVDKWERVKQMEGNEQ